MGKVSLPFSGLTKIEWERLGDAAALLALGLVVLFSSYAMMPIAALFPYRLARGVWIVLNWTALLCGLALACDALGWRVSGWRRWLAHLVQPDFRSGLTHVLDGPEFVGERRRLCTLLHWLQGRHVTGVWAWGGMCGRRRGGRLVGVQSDGVRHDLGLAAAVGSLTTVLLTPYALMYDYPVLIMALFWLWREWRVLTGTWIWVCAGILAFMVSVLVWAGPESDGYWLVLSACAQVMIIVRRRAVQMVAQRVEVEL